MLITYNGIDVFVNQQEPLIAKTTSFPSDGDNRILVEDTITLVGELTGCSLAELVVARNQVINVFSESFKTLYIDVIGSFKDVKIESVNFDESPYLASLPYTITLLHYPDGGYEFGFGITSPKNTYTYTENIDGTLSISQEISAQGINTTNSYPGNGLQNATTFVKAQLPKAIPRPATIDTTKSNFGMYLVEFSEEIDKINKIVTINRTFETDMSAVKGAIILRYTSEITEEEGEESVTSYNGTVDAGRENNLVGARKKYKEFRDGLKDLGPFINENVTEDPNINNISFSFSQVEGPEMMDDFTISLEENSDSSLFSVSINGNISTRGRCMSDENFARIEAEYNDSSQGHRFDVCQDLYEDFYTEDHGSEKSNPGVTLNSNVIAKSIGINEYDQSASYSASYNDRQALFGTHSFDFTVSLTPSLFPVKAVPSAYTNGWIFEDLGYRSRATFSISMNARSFEDPLERSEFVNLAQTQFGEFAGGASDIYVTMDQYTVSNQKVTSATYAQTFHSDTSFTNDTDYTTIQSFEL
jgi:hypothetical protein